MPPAGIESGVGAGGPDVVVVGGAGQVGRLVADAINAHGGPTTSLTVVDPAAPDTDSALDLIHSSDGPAPILVEADVVVLAVPEAVANAMGPTVLETVGPDALVVDTLSVKDRWFRLVTRTNDRPAVISINPMFAPSLGFDGRPVAVVELPSPVSHHDRWSIWFRRVLAATGCCPVPVKAIDHDRLTAGLQVATHAAVLAFGATMVELGLDLDQVRGLAPPPHQTMLALLARIVAGEPHVYHDIQHGHPLAGETRAAMVTGLQRLDAAAAVADPAAYAAFIEPIADLVAGSSPPLTDVCSRLFTQLSMLGQ